MTTRLSFQRADAALACLACLWLAPAAWAAPDVIELVFTYGSEKEEWVKEVTAAFNKAGYMSGGKLIRVEAFPTGSGECIDEVLDPKKPRTPEHKGKKASGPAHITSPASGIYVALGNRWSERAGDGRLLGKEKERPVRLVRSPVVIAMWKPMAVAMGWPRKQLGWKDIHKLVGSPKGWGEHGHDDWGRFKFGHTHPLFSNSGLCAILAEVYAAAGKTEDLTAADVARAGKYLEELEKGIVHYGASTGFFGKKMFANSTQYLNAAVMYENMVVESYLPPFKGKLADDVVAIYPKEGSVWSDHPVAVVNRPWVTDAHRAAAKAYIEFLMADEQQKKAVAYGFRPGKETVAVTAPLDSKHGVDPENEPRAELAVPDAEVMEKVIDLWKKHKKRSRIVLVIDISGSMADDGKLVNAKKGARELLSMLGERDSVSLLVFNGKLYWKDRDVDMTEEGRKAMSETIASLRADGKTSLYDAVDAAYSHLADKGEKDRIGAVVVLTDGEDTSSKLMLPELMKKTAFDPEKRPARIFTICYGASAAKPTDEEMRLRKILEKVSEATRAKSYIGDPKNIRKVFKDIATFF
jgi:Ca-activated chloride channel family protein